MRRHIMCTILYEDMRLYMQYHLFFSFALLLVTKFSDHTEIARLNKYSSLHAHCPLFIIRIKPTEDKTCYETNYSDSNERFQWEGLEPDMCNVYL